MKVNFFSNNNVQFPEDGKGIFLALIALLTLSVLVLIAVMIGR